MKFEQNKGFKEFGKRPAPAQPETTKEGRMSAEARVQLLRGMQDVILNEMLDTWETIRAFQEAGHGAGVEDSRQLDELLGRMNGRLSTLGKMPVTREDLP